jgi:hypothetical protein
MLAQAQAMLAQAILAQAMLAQAILAQAMLAHDSTLAQAHDLGAKQI